MALSALFDEAALDMLDACGVSTSRRATISRPTADHACLASFIGFTGTHLRGSLTVLGSVEVFRTTHPGQTALTSISETDISDWCCEFSNQLLGRLKNKLLRRAVDIELSTPQGIAAEKLRLSAHGGGALLLAEFEVGPHVLTTALDLTVDETLTFAECAAGSESAGEGDVMLL